MKAIWLLLTVSFCSVPCCAAVVQLGTLSFDILLPGSAVSPGVNSFVIANLTGDRAAGGFGVPSAFPVLDFLTFLNSKLTLTGDVSTTIELGDLGPGFHSSGELEFPDTVQFTSALFSAELDVTEFVLHDGTSFKALSRDLAVTLVPSSGSNLVAGVDIIVIPVSDVPEPATGLLVSAAAILLGVRRYRSGQNSPHQPR